MDSTKIIIGLTGLYCSGKSTVEKILKENYGFYSIDVDKIGYLALDEKSSEITDGFGTGVINQDNGKIDRKKLGKIVFNDRKKLLFLNSIVHPFMKKKIEEILSSIDEKKICINAALLYEVGLSSFCKKILITKISFFETLKRGRLRDNYSFFRIIKIMSSQKVLSFAKKNVDNAEIFYVDNKFDSEYLKRQIDIIVKTNKL